MLMNLFAQLAFNQIFCRPEFPKPHIYQGSIDCEAWFWICSFVTIIRNACCAFARIANDYLTTLIFGYLLFKLNSCDFTAFICKWISEQNKTKDEKKWQRIWKYNVTEGGKEKICWLIRNQVLSLSICGLYAHCHHKI